MRTVSTLFRNVEDMKLLLEKPKYPVTGFEFLLDCAENEPEEVLPLGVGMPRVKGFYYVDDAGVSYGDA